MKILSIILKKTETYSDLIFDILASSSILIPVVISSTYFLTYSLLISIIKIAFTFSVIVECCYLSLKLTDNYAKKREMKLFKQDYPNLESNISLEELRKELVKYEELSKVPKDIETKKEESLSNFSEYEKYSYFFLLNIS